MAQSESNRGKPATRGRQLRGWVVNIVLILVIFSGIQWWKARPLASGEAPSLAGETLNGNALDLARYRGEPVLVHFWASWCPVCKAMDGTIDSIAKDHPVVTVAMQSGDALQVRRFMNEAALHFDVVPDPYGQIASLWGVPGVPATFVLDPAGRIAYSTVGFSTELGLRARIHGAARTE
ncbi:MAG: protein disulfide oxidoreductase [Anaerolineae bacterium]